MKLAFFTALMQLNLAYILWYGFDLITCSSLSSISVHQFCFSYQLILGSITLCLTLSFILFPCICQCFCFGTVHVTSWISTISLKPEFTTPVISREGWVCVTPFLHFWSRTLTRVTNKVTEWFVVQVEVTEFCLMN